MSRSSLACSIARRRLGGLGDWPSQRPHTCENNHLPRTGETIMAEGKARKMWALPGAQLTAPQSLLMHGGDATMMLDLPCPSFLIEHPKGLVLFDTGCNPKIIDDAVGYWGDVAAHLPLKWNKADTLDKQIQ